MRRGTFAIFDRSARSRATPAPLIPPPRMITSNVSERNRAMASARVFSVTNGRDKRLGLYGLALTKSFEEHARDLAAVLIGLFVHGFALRPGEAIAEAVQALERFADDERSRPGDSGLR